VVTREGWRRTLGTIDPISADQSGPGRLVMNRRHSGKRQAVTDPSRRRRRSTGRAVIPAEQQETQLNRRLIVARIRAWSHR
jgi:hypothetical protein